MLLAGGQGSRIGGNKPAVIYRGRSLLDWSCQLLEAIPIARENKFISVASGSLLALPLPFNRVEDLAPNQGPLGGIYSALEWPSCRGAEWLLTLPVDMPHLPTDIFARLCAAYRPGCQIIRAASRERSFPTVALVATSVKSELRAFMTNGGRKLFDFQNQFMTIEARILSPTESLNINRREDLVG